jgi:UDP-N-acetylglucosamine pyrophosphorylase
MDEAIAAKMRAAAQPEAAIRAFLRHAARARQGGAGWIVESEIEPPREVAAWEELPAGDDPALSSRTAVVKLNGGLGTGMGLEKAKSLLAVKDGASFLTLTRRQLAAAGARSGMPPRFLLLNSFSTSADTRAALAAEPVPGAPEPWEMVQSKAPKLDAATLAPVRWPRQPELEWCPPGHGDIYPTLAGGTLRALQEAGVEFLFVSNADNLGATLDPRILAHFAASGAPFLMEVALRTPADRKGGHLARRRRDGRLILRESAQCAPEDEAAFQDISRHRYFNTNNLWLRVDALADALARNGGFLELPLIVNRKTVDPRDKASTPVLQLETAMGAAIEIFDGSRALAVPRTRFAPVKSTADLLVVRSNAYAVDEGGRLHPDPACAGQMPVVRLDDLYFKLMGDFEVRFPHGAPSLKNCRSLTVKGDWTFEAGVVFEGDVELSSSVARILPAGVYSGPVGGGGSC